MNDTSAPQLDIALAGFELFFGRPPEPDERQRLQALDGVNAVRDHLTRHRLSVDIEDVRALSARQRPFLFFVHVPKTGGSTFRHELSHRLHDRAFIFQRPGKVAPDAPASGDFTVMYRKQSQSFFWKHDVAIGHFMYLDIPQHLIAGNSAILCGCMRDPIARIVSLYKFIQRSDDHPLNAIMRPLTLAQGLRSVLPFRRMCSNTQLRFLTGTATYREAQQVLAQHRFVIGKLEAIDTFREAVFDLLGLTPAGAFEKVVNVNPQGYADVIGSQADYADFLDDARNLTQEEQKLFDQFDDVLRSDL